MYLTVPRGMRVCAAVAALALGGSAFAEIIEVQNSSFEAPVLADGTVSMSVPGWYAGNAGALNPREHSLPGGPLYGDNVATVSGNGVLSRILDTEITGNTRYELSVDVAARSEFEAGDWLVQLFSYDNGIHVLLDEARNLFEPNRGGPFETVSLVFEVPEISELIGTNLKIRLANTTFGDMNPVLYDNVRLTATAMPTPGALALLGLAGLCGRRRRQR